MFFFAKWLFDEFAHILPTRIQQRLMNVLLATIICNINKEMNNFDDFFLLMMYL